MGTFLSSAAVYFKLQWMTEFKNLNFKVTRNGELQHTSGIAGKEFYVNRFQPINAEIVRGHCTAETESFQKKITNHGSKAADSQEQTDYTRRL